MPESGGTRSDLIAEILSELYAALGEEVQRMSADFDANAPWIDRGFSYRTSQLVAERSNRISGKLPKGHPFAESWELAERVMDEFSLSIDRARALGSTSIPMDELASTAANSILAGTLSFHFRLPFSWIEFEVQPPDPTSLGPFSLAVQEHESGRRRSVLTGVVEATCLTRARLAVERKAGEIAGLMLSAGVLDLVIPKPLLRSASTLELSTHESGTFYRFEASSEILTGIEGSSFEFLRPLDELESRRGSDAALMERLRRIASLLSSTSSDARALCAAAGATFQAVCSVHDGGSALLTAVLALEGLLLEGSRDNLSARLQDAVAYSLGRSREIRREIRKRVSHIYKRRSEFVHEGSWKGSQEDIGDAITMLRDILWQELRHLDVVASEEDDRAID